MKRRTLLLGIGTIVGGGSYVFGTGAFSQTEARRTVTISTAGDAEAYLRLEPGRGDTAEFVSQNDDGVVTVAIGPLDGGTGEGPNPGAVMRFREVLRISNYGTDAVTVSASFPTDGGVALVTGYGGPENVVLLDGSEDELQLQPGESGLAGIALDTGYGTDEIPGTVSDSGDVEITITASTN